MNTDYKTTIQVDLGFEVNETRPITTYSETLEHAKCAHSHAHSRAQIISCDRGIMEVHTPHTIWTVNPLQSVFIASMEEHQVYFPDHVTVLTAFVDESKLPPLPTQSFAFEPSSFFNSLLVKIVSFSNPSEPTDTQFRILEVFLDELALLTPSTTYLPTSQNLRLKPILDSLKTDLSTKHTLAYYAQKSYMSSRTLSRLFQKELGMSFGDWKMRLKLMEAVKLLGEEKSIKEIALDLGYENVSSFITAFKNYFGKTPTNYL